MRVMPLLALVCGAVASAQPVIVPAPAPAGKLTDMRVEREPLVPVVLRGQQFPLGSFVTMRDELENFPLDTSFGGTGVSAPPTSFTGPEGFVWPLNNLRGQADASIGSGWVRMVDLSGGPVSGPNGVINASKALRILTVVAQPPGGFFTGANLRFGGGEPGEPTLPLEPLPDMNARVSAEHYLSSIDTQYTFEPAATFTGFIAGRMLWGGTCIEVDPGDCTDMGFPVGTINSFLVLRINPNFSGPPLVFLPGVYCEDTFGNQIPGCVPPAGSNVGDVVRPPIQAWFRIAAETTSDGRFRFLVDHLDGQPEFTVYDNILLTHSYIDRVGWNTSFESDGAFMLADNIEASGPLYQPNDPPPLTCPYLDDMDWLGRWVLGTQGPRWEAPSVFRTTVIAHPPRGNVIQQSNDAPNNLYGRTMATHLPVATASPANDLIARLEVSTTGSTVRGFALFDGEHLTARVFLGRDDGSKSPGWFDPGVYAQINPGYEPVDDPQGEDPYDNIPVIGVDVADSGYDWATDEYRTIELRLSANGALRASIDGARIYAGAGAFWNAVDRFAFESENNTLGSGATLRINDVAFVCDAPSCAADFDLDDAITFTDLNAVLSNFGASGLPSGTINPGDANSDGVVDFSDLNAVLSSFGTSCE